MRRPINEKAHPLNELTKQQQHDLSQYMRTYKERKARNDTRFPVSDDMKKRSNERTTL